MRMVSSFLTGCVLCVLFLGCALPGFGQVIRVDPNSGQAPQPVSSESADARLAQNVSYQAWHTPVKTVLDELSESTGVSLFAGYNSQDWQVRDRKMNICVKDVTLAQLMNSIARVMKFKWSVNDEVDPPTYRLCADRRMLAKLQVKATQLERELKREEVKRRTGLVEAFEFVADASGSKLEELKDINPYLYMCAESGFAKLMVAVFEEQPKLREAFTNAERTAKVDASMFSPSTQQLFTETIRKMWPLDHIADSRAPLSESLERDFPKGDVNFSWMATASETQQRKKLFYYGYQSAWDTHDGHMLGDLRDPYAESTQVWAKTCMGAVERGESPGHGFSKLVPDYWESEVDDAREIEHYMMFDDVTEHPDEPDLHKKIVITVSEEEQKALQEQAQKLGWQVWPRLVYQAVLKAFTEAADLDVVSDSFNVVLGVGSPRIQDDELHIMLDTMTDFYKCNWEKHGNMLEFRRRDWFRRRASQIPDEWIEPWREELEEKNVLSLDNYASMVVLTDDQIEENIRCDALLSQIIGPCWEYGDKREMCRLYLQMSDTQRKLLASEGGLNLSLLPPRQQRIYSEMFKSGWQRRWCSEEFADVGSGRLTMKLSSEANDDGSKIYTFTVYMSNDDGTVEEQKWVARLPKLGVSS